jgi:hypothetical protein
MLNSYSEIYNFGHKCLDGIFDDEVVIEEKIDGSQFSFGRKDGKLFCRSKGKDQTDATDKMFTLARANMETLALVDGWTYRGEYLSKPKHNTLCYSRTPILNVIIYDIDMGNQHYVLPETKKQFCETIGLECVPVLFRGKISSISEIKELLSTKSILGGDIEGVVIKNYNKYAPDKKILMAKLVREEFKERHTKEWKSANPSGLDKIAEIAQKYCTKARWEKAIQHLRDEGLLKNDVTDISNLLKEINIDIEKECIDDIKEDLYKWAKSHINRAATRGFPEWYKSKLVESFETREFESD